MIAFVVSVNGKRICTAGIRDGGIATVDMSWVAKSPKNNGLLFHVGGIETSTNEILDWDVPKLKLGDKITVEITETDQVDPSPDRSPRKCPGKSPVE